MNLISLFSGCGGLDLGVEQGKRNPSIKSLEKIVIALEISFHDFFEGM